MTSLRPQGAPQLHQVDNLHPSTRSRVRDSSYGVPFLVGSMEEFRELFKSSKCRQLHVFVIKGKGNILDTRIVHTLFRQRNELQLSCISRHTFNVLQMSNKLCFRARTLEVVLCPCFVVYSTKTYRSTLLQTSSGIGLGGAGCCNNGTRMRLPAYLAYGLGRSRTTPSSPCILSRLKFYECRMCLYDFVEVLSTDEHTSVQ